MRLVVSTMATRHNLGALRGRRARRGTTCRSSRRSAGRTALEELLPLLRRELRRRGAVAVHGNRHTDFVAALCAAHLHEARGVDPAEALARAAAAGLMVTGYACALLGVELAEVDALMGGGGRGSGERQH